MTQSTDSPRSSELMSRHDSSLLVVDVQDRLLNAIPHSNKIVWNIRRLVDGAAILDVPVIATEQYPEKLGATTATLAERITEIPSKLSFSCVPCTEANDRLRQLKRHKILVVGIESHVCVQQTVLDLLSDGYQVYVATDAVGSRFSIDYEIALRRMEASGATITTTEAALFEWCEVAGTPEFKQISSLVREPAPE